MHTLLSIAIAMIAGLLLTRVVKLVKLPNVTGYLVAGLLIGPYCFRLVSADTLATLDIITVAALGFIAFSIGSEFKLSHIKAIGGKILVITACEAVGAVILVDLVVSLLGFPVPMALCLGAIAAATAPAATLLVVRQYRAQGELTSTLLPVVAMDDAIGLMAYAISVSIAKMIQNGEAFNFMSTLVSPLLEILLSLAVGGVIGVIVAISNRFFHSRANRLMICIAAVMLGVGVAQQFGLSHLLLCMSIGAVYVNLRDDAIQTLEQAESWTAPLFMLFFVISGADLNVAVLPSLGLLGVVYIVTRVVGKYFGAYIGCTISKTSHKIRKYLGLSLIPQAGVAIGIAQLVVKELPEYGASIQAVILCATLIYELIGPVITKYSLLKAGEIVVEPKHQKNKDAQPPQAPQAAN
ncbi:MAG: cation:proton antiporter [Eubacteriales bacterium]|nr:cation:proton antiporter [Eubacteriales bacterium]